MFTVTLYSKDKYHKNMSLLSCYANYIKQAAHFFFGNNVTCYMSAISNIT